MRLLDGWAPEGMRLSPCRTSSCLQPTGRRLQTLAPPHHQPLPLVAPHRVPVVHCQVGAEVPGRALERALVQLQVLVLVLVLVPAMPCMSVPGNQWARAAQPKEDRR